MEPLTCRHLEAGCKPPEVSLHPHCRRPSGERRARGHLLTGCSPDPASAAVPPLPQTWRLRPVTGAPRAPPAPYTLTALGASCSPLRPLTPPAPTLLFYPHPLPTASLPPPPSTPNPVLCPTIPPTTPACPSYPHPPQPTRGLTNSRCPVSAEPAALAQAGHSLWAQRKQPPP